MFKFSPKKKTPENSCTSETKKVQQPINDILQLQKVVGNRAVQDIIQKQSNHTGLPDNVKRGVEYLSGVDISDVRVKYNSPEPAKVNALAFAQGNNIHVAPRQEKHIAHEAWHTVQQKQGRVKATKSVSGKPINDSRSLEREADIMGKRASVIGRMMSHFSPSPIQNKSSNTIQRYIENDQGQVVKLNPSKEEKAEQKVLLDQLNTEVRRRVAAIDKFNPKFLDTLIWNAMLKTDDSERKFTIKDIVSYIKHHAPEKGDTDSGSMEELDLTSIDLKQHAEEVLGHAPDEKNKGEYAKMIKTAKQHAIELTMLYSVAVESSKRLANLTQHLQRAGGVDADIVVRKFPGVKSMDRAAFKTVIKKQGSTKEIADILASSIVYNSLEDLADALPKIRKFLADPENNVTLRAVKNRISEPSKQGYRDILLNIELNSGHVAEIQLHIAKMIAAKKKGHKLYEDEREISEEFEGIDVPGLKALFKDVDKFVKDKRNKEAIIDSINRMRTARKLPQSKLVKKLSNQVKATEAAELKQELIKDLQQQAFEKYYGPAWEEEKNEYSEDEFNNLMSEIGKLNTSGNKEQNIKVAYKKLFKKEQLINLHHTFFEFAFRSVIEQEYKLGRDVIENLANFSSKQQ